MNIDVLSFNKQISSALEDQALLMLRWARQASCSSSPVLMNTDVLSFNKHISSTLED